MELKSRQIHILQTLLTNEKGIAPDEFMEKLGVHKRTVYYDLEKINEWLKYFGLGKVIISGQAIHMEISNTTALDQQLRQGSTYYFSIAERYAMEMLYIALSSENVTINSLMMLFEVSKNTILKDIKEVRDELERWGLCLNSTIKTGYLITGEEMTIRKILGEQFRLLLNTGGQARMQNFLQESLVSLYNNEIDFGELCRCLIKQYETDIHGDYILANIELIIVMIQISLIRSRKGSIIRLNSDEQLALMKSLSFRSVEFSLQKLRVHGVEVAMQETYYITSLFLGIQTTDFLSQEQEDTLIEELAQELVLNFEHIACLSFPNRERLQKQLSHHIRPMYYRIKYGIPDKNPLVNDIKTMYPFVFDFTKKAVQATEMKILAGDVSEDELAYLCVYFVSNLNEKYLIQAKSYSKEVLIVGPENMAVATLMREQLQDLFGLSMNYHVISVNKLREWMLNDYVLVVSLVQLDKRFHCEKIVITGPIITEDTQRRIMEILRGDKSLARYDEMIRDVIERVKKCVDKEFEYSKMYFELFRYFEEKERGKHTNAKSDIFYKKIEQSNFAKLPEAIDMQEILLLLSRILRQGAAGQRLEQRMVNLLQNKKLQTYHIQKDVLLVHFPLQGEANPKIDVCIALAPEGIRDMDDVCSKIIVGIATKDSYSHWEMLDDIYRYFSDQSHVDGIKQLFQNIKE